MMTMHDELRALRNQTALDGDAWVANRIDAILAEYADWVCVPREPDDHMRAAGFESQAFTDLSDAVVRWQGWPYSCREAAGCVDGVYRAMIAAKAEEE